jgi:nucleoside-diphosphate-sugar epimerase
LNAPVKVLVTGASGFVGQAIIARLSDDGREVFAASRSPPSTLPRRVAYVPLNALGDSPQPLVRPCASDVVVHAAARVHLMHDRAANPLVQFRAVNTEGSLALARQTRAWGARRFVYISSIKVFGESSTLGRPLDATSPPAPVEPYGVSKLEAELALASFCAECGMELVVIRPPLVYGPGVGANFRRLMQAIASGWPLPFGRLNDNRRSLVGLENLVDLIAACIDHPNAAGRTLLVSDGEDLSTASLVHRLANALNKHARLLPVPVAVLQFAGAMLGRRSAVQRLCGTLQVDIRATCRELCWSPPKTVDEGFARTALQFLQETHA